MPDGVADGHDRNRSPPGPAGEREDFLWLHRSMWADERHRENLFAFARRHGIAVVVAHPRSTAEDVVTSLRPPLEAASEFGLDAWVNVGVLSETTAESFVAGGPAREAHLSRLRDIARLHGELFDGGRVVCWQEAPVMGRWVESGEWNAEAAENMVEYGPRVFAAQRRAIREANPDLSVGAFVHFPYVVDSKQPEAFAELARGFRRQEAVPEFAFADFYRGWYEKDVGPGPANAAVRSLISNARTHLDGRPVFYVGQSHTVNPQHTPSRQAMRMNLRASLDAGAAGIGWYARSEHVPTGAGFDPFLPNAEGSTFDGGPANTATFARDRFLYPWLATLDATPGFDPAAAFDIWLAGDGFGFADHRLSARTGDGDWELLGDFDGYLDGDYPYDDGRVAAFRALDRERLLGAGRLDLRIETAAGSDGATLAAVLALPCDPDCYVAEGEAARLVAGDADLSGFAIGRAAPGVALSPGETVRVSVPVAAADATSLRGLVHPDHGAVVRELAAFEADRDGFDHGARFDLWLAGSGLADPADAPALLDRDGTARNPADAAVATAATDRVALFCGLRRERFRPAAGLRVADDGGPDATDRAAYAMPYAGHATFRPPERAADLLESQPGEVATFAIDVVEPS